MTEPGHKHRRCIGGGEFLLVVVGLWALILAFHAIGTADDQDLKACLAQHPHAVRMCVDEVYGPTKRGH